MGQDRRFTAWLRANERDALEREADEQGTSVNFILRMAVRQYFGMSTPRMERTPVTTVTRNK